MKKTIILTGLLVAIMVACKKKEILLCCVNSPNIGIGLNYVNGDSQDLLNYTTTGYFPVEKMKLYHIEDGTKKLEEPNYLFVDTTISLDLLSIPIYMNVANWTSKDGDYVIGQSTNLIQLNEVITDTIVTEWYHNSSNYNSYVKRFWYNGKLYNGVGVQTIIKK